MADPVYHSGLVTFTAAFQEPAFHLSHDSQTLQRSIFHALNELELDWPSFEEVGAQAGPGKWYLSVSFLFFRASLKVRVDGVEVVFRSARSNDTKLIKDVLASIDSALREALPQTRVARRELLWQGHFELPDKDYLARLQPFCGSAPQGLGKWTGQGVALYFESSLASGENEVVLERSAQIPGGLFLKVGCRFDADEFELATSLDNFEAYLADVDRAFSMGGSVGGAK